MPYEEASFDACTRLSTEMSHSSGNKIITNVEDGVRKTGRMMNVQLIIATAYLVDDFISPTFFPTLSVTFADVGDAP